MKPTQFKNLIKTMHTAKDERAILVEAAPGVGKTSIVGQAAKELGVGFMVIHAPLMQPEDYGMPVIHGADKDLLKFVVSAEKFPIEGSKCPECGIFLIDELPQADHAAQKILANLVEAREIHGHKIKAGWTIVATGNRVSDKSGANRILNHLSDRMTRVPLEVSLDDWTTWALDNDVKTEVISFIRFRPGLLADHENKTGEKNPTPRAWVKGVSKRMGVISADLEFEVFAGDVGEGPAAEFLAFLKTYRNLPNPDSILLDPKKAKVPTDPATLYALTGAITTRVTEDNFDRAMTYMRRLPPEFVVLFVRDVTKLVPGVASTRAMIDWAAKDGKNLLS